MSRVEWAHLRRWNGTELGAGGSSYTAPVWCWPETWTAGQSGGGGAGEGGRRLGGEEVRGRGVRGMRSDGEEVRE